MIKKKPNEWKICQYPGCNKQIPQFWKTITEKEFDIKCVRNVHLSTKRLKKEKVEKRKAKSKIEKGNHYGKETCYYIFKTCS